MQEETIEHGIRSFADMIEKASSIGLTLPPNSFDKVFIIGMGASGIAGDLIKSYFTELGSRIPVFVVKDYIIPEFMDSKSLVFVISYSGNTEETLYAFKSSKTKAGKIVVITSGGKLEKACLEEKQEIIKVPSGMKPRTALPYLFFPAINTLINSKVIKGEIHYREIISSIRKIGLSEKANELSEKLLGKTPIIYSSNRLYPVALRWKTQFNENSKVHAFCSTFPEMGHNEIMAFSKESDEFFIIILSDESDFSRVRQRIVLTKEVMVKKSETTEIVLKGDDFLTKAFSAIYIGDLASYMLAQKYGLNPEETGLIEEMKEVLKRKV